MILHMHLTELFQIKLQSIFLLKHQLFSEINFSLALYANMMPVDPDIDSIANNISMSVIDYIKNTNDLVIICPEKS